MPMFRLQRFGFDRKERMGLTSRRQDRNTIIYVWADIDNAGCPVTRKSMSGGVVMLGSRVVKGWSTTQSVRALSSGEAEYYGRQSASG